VIIKGLILAALLGGMYFSIHRLETYSKSILPKGRENVDVVLDLQFRGYTCERAVELLSSLSPQQREGMKRVYTDLYDVFWPLSILAVNAFVAYWATGRIISSWLIVPLLVFGSDMLENTLIVAMINKYGSQEASGIKKIDLTPECSIVGSYVTPFKWSLLPLNLILVALMIYSNRSSQHKVEAKKKTK